MKNKAQYIAVIALSVSQAYNIFRGLDYYKSIFTSFDWLQFGGIYIIQEIFGLLVQFLEPTLIAIFFTSAGQYQDKAYKLLRFLFLMSLFLYMPYTLYYYIFKGDQLFSDSDARTLLIHTIGVIISITCAVLFLRAKPQSQPAKVDLSEYELVNYTSTGHRFVHRLLDTLFILPIFLFWGRVLQVNNEYILQLIFILVYLVYCFLAESLFRQTLGKIATNSCVTTIGTSYSVGRILVRTLARLIPFDAISFLFRANWHDTTTSTSVVYIDTWEKVFDDTTPAGALATRK